MDPQLKHLLRSIDSSLVHLVGAVARIAIALETAVEGDPFNELINALDPTATPEKKPKEDVVESPPNPDDMPIDEWLAARERGDIR